MNRQYPIGAYLDMIAQVEAALTTRDGLPPAITTDVICGFPGETEDDFAQTVDIARRVGFLHMHVFPYSPRVGTAAARWTDRAVPTATKRSRVRRLIALENDPADGLSIRYRRRLVGRTVRVILEQPSRDRPGISVGRCDHYALLCVPTDRPRGTLMEVTVTEARGSETRARPADRWMPLTVLQPVSPSPPHDRHPTPTQPTGEANI
jgi:tRNA A37 methylthiotransferase MiaB